MTGPFDILPDNSDREIYALEMFILYIFLFVYFCRYSIRENPQNNNLVL